VEIPELILPVIDPDQCDGCGLCIRVCATGALGMVNGKAALVRPEACNYSNTCEDVCPTDAIALPYQVVFADEAE
jgi:NAD-dependent dihydropyrimidine dehydrogenase PreA subunit